MFIYVVLAYFIIVIIEYLYLRFYLANWKQNLGESIFIKDIEFNIRNEKELRDSITDFLNKRVQLLDKMTYYDWIQYNNDNVLFTFKGRKYYLYIYEKNNDSDNPSTVSNFILRASYQKELVNLDFQEESSQVNKRYVVFELFPTNEKLIDEMYFMNEIVNGCNVIDYFWEDPFKKRAIKKKAYFKKFIKKINENDSITGLVGLGYEIADLDYEHSNTYLHYMGTPFVVFISFISFIMAIILYYISHAKTGFRPIMLMVIINIFLMVQSSMKGTISNIQLEQTRMNDINSSILGMSFLVAVNIFIIQNIKQSHGSRFLNLYSQIAYLFCCALIFLLLSMYKTLNFTDVESLRRRRVQNQTFFNISIILNLIIFFGYLLFVSKRLNAFNIKI